MYKSCSIFPGGNYTPGGFDSQSTLKTKTTQWVVLFFGAGYGSRLRYGGHQFLNWWQQQSPGLLHLEWFDSLPLQKNNSPPVGVLLFLEQGTGVEPASEAWEATIIADILTLHGLYYSKQY